MKTKIVNDIVIKIPEDSGPAVILRQRVLGITVKIPVPVENMHDDILVHHVKSKVSRFLSVVDMATAAIYSIVGIHEPVDTIKNRFCPFGGLENDTF